MYLSHVILAQAATPNAFVGNHAGFAIVERPDVETVYGMKVLWNSSIQNPSEETLSLLEKYELMQAHTSVEFALKMSNLFDDRRSVPVGVWEEIEAIAIPRPFSVTQFSSSSYVAIPTTDMNEYPVFKVYPNPTKNVF